MTDIDHLEQKSMNRLNLIILDEKFDVLIDIAKQIPFLEALIETKTNEFVVINEVSPKFFRILINFIKNQEKIYWFERDINIFEKEDIERWLKYLGMDVLINKLFGRKYVNGKLVITDIVMMSDKCGRRYKIFTLCDGRSVTGIDVNNTLVSISGVKCKIDGYNNLLVKSNLGTNIPQIVFLPIEDIIIDDGSYFITFDYAVRHKLINNAQFCSCPVGSKNHCADSIFDKVA